MSTGTASRITSSTVTLIVGRGHADDDHAADQRPDADPDGHRRAVLDSLRSTSASKSSAVERRRRPGRPPCSGSGRPCGRLLDDRRVLGQAGRYDRDRPGQRGRVARDDEPGVEEGGEARSRRSSGASSGRGSGGRASPLHLGGGRRRSPHRRRSAAPIRSVAARARVRARQRRDGSAAAARGPSPPDRGRAAAGPVGARVSAPGGRGWRGRAAPRSRCARSAPAPRGSSGRSPRTRPRRPRRCLGDPSAARWRVPKRSEWSEVSVSGSSAAAATIRPSRTITAPSWSAVRGAKIVPSSSADRSAWSITPDSRRTPRGPSRARSR